MVRRMGDYRGTGGGSFRMSSRTAGVLAISLMFLAVVIDAAFPLR